VNGSRPREEEPELVRCLDCGAVYRLPLDEHEAPPCPDYGGVGWIVLDVPRAHDYEKKS
jgi:hypothetical protein